MYNPGQIFYNQLITQNISGVPTNADATPQGHMVHNGIDDFSVSVFFTNIDAGRYTVSGVIPGTYKQTDSIGVISSGYVNGLLGKSFLDLGQLSVTMYSGGLDYINVDGVNLRQAISLISAVMAGSSTVNGNNISYYAVNNNGTIRINSTAISGARNSLVIFLP